MKSINKKNKFWQITKLAQNLILKLQLSQSISMQFQREAKQDQPQNSHAINIQHTLNLVDSSKQQSRPNRSSSKKQQPPFTQKLNSEQLSEEEEVILKIDQFNALPTQSQQDWENLKILLQKHILPNIHPRAQTEAGKKLLGNGKFVVAFIKVMTRNLKKDFLKNYLLNHFEQQTEILQEREVFKAFCQEAQNKANTSTFQTVNRNKNHLGCSPASSKNDVNWSSVAQHDENSSKKSFVTSPGKDGQKLKRSRIKEEPRSEESNDSKRKASKNIKKVQNSVKHSKSKSTKKTKLEVENKEALKTMKSSAKKTVPKSSMVLKTKSIEDVIRSNPNNENDQEQTQLGSYYHYEIGINKKSQKQLMQVRTSARLNNKKQNSSTESRRVSSRIKNSVSKSKSKKNQKQSLQKSKKEKADDSPSEESSSVSEYKQETETNSQQEDMVEVDWVKSHLKQLKIKNVQLYSDYKALTQNDNQITQFLLQMENSQEAQDLENTSKGIKSQRQIIVNQKNQSLSKPDVIQEFQHEAQAEGESYFLALPKSEEDKPRQFEEIKNEFQIGQLPLTIDYVVDPDLCNHGIYALLRLGRVTQLQMGTPFAVSPLTYSIKISRKNIKQSLQKAKQLAGQFADNIGYVPTNQLILDMIGSKKKQMESHT